MVRLYYEYSNNKNLEQDIYENDSYVRRKIKDIILKNNRGSIPHDGDNGVSI